MPSLLVQLIGHLQSRRRWQLVGVGALMLLGAVSELLSLGALLPLLTVIADTKGSMAEQVRGYLSIVGLRDANALLSSLVGLFALAIVGAALLRLLLLYATEALSNGIAYDLGTRIFEDTLHQPYSYHTKHNSSELIATVGKVDLVTSGVITPFMNGAVALVIALAISAGLLAINPLVAISAGAGFGVIYFGVVRFSRPRLKANGQIIARAQARRVRAMQEGLGGIRDIILDNSQGVFAAAYSEAEGDLRAARARNAIAAGAPRSLVEALGMVLIAVLAMVMASAEGGLAAAIPSLGALAMGAQKLLPLAQSMYLGWASSTGNTQSLIDVLALLERPRVRADRSHEALPFVREIRLENVRFGYGSGSRLVLDGVDLTIPKGYRIGIMGKSGSGKSTLIDILTGLVEPIGGRLLVDGEVITKHSRQSWHKKIAHVPQSIYLSDASVAENIAFGVPTHDIDIELVAASAKQAELSDFIESMPDKWNTRVGERGVKLSGGQRQRIGIARALYKRAELLVFDEATSALDDETESAVMSSIGRLGGHLTIIIISHRQATLAACEVIKIVQGGKLIDRSK